MVACASLRFSRNHIGEVEPRAFKGLRFLCALDLSTNHLSRLQLAPPTVSRLTVLKLRNNTLGPDLGGITSLGPRLRRLDLSLNKIESLEGIGRLVGLHVLVASGNRLTGELPPEMSRLASLALLDLEHNSLSGLSFEAFGGMHTLSTLRIAHNQLASGALRPLASALGAIVPSQSLRRLTAYGNPFATDRAFPDALTSVLPALYELDHARLGAGVLAAAGGDASRRSVAEAVDSIANSALAQHAVLLEKHRAAHDALLETLRRQKQAAVAGLQEYRAITSKAEDIFRAAVADAKRAADRTNDQGGGMNAAMVVDKMLSVRQQLLSSERVSLGRYREAVNATTEDVQEALRRVTEGVGAVDQSK
jgi:hypothetical protein